MTTEQKTAEQILVESCLNDIDKAETPFENGLISVASAKAAMRNFAKLKCREQREICAESAKALLDQNDEPWIIKSSVLNAIEPEI
jgi:hypothetical protein